MSWALPGAILFMLGLVLLLGYFLSRKVFPIEEQGDQVADPSSPSPCDVCGEAGCGGFAKALVRGGFEDPGAAEGKGKEVSCDCGSVEDSLARPRQMKAAILCSGTRVAPRYHYSGAPSCRTAARMAVGPKECGNACLGFGDCCSACPSRAVSVYLEQGIARIDPSRCNGCGDCLRSCPLDLIDLIPAGKGLTVLCKGPYGPSEGWTCPDGCTLCGLCIDACPEGALKGSGTGLPQWIEEHCNGCGLCVEACPQDVVLLYDSAAKQRVFHHPDAAHRLANSR